MRIGYEKAGGICVYSNEWDKYCQQTYFANFAEKPDGDITLVEASSIPDHDILVAGFPCQPFSIAGVSKKQSLEKKVNKKYTLSDNLWNYLQQYSAKHKAAGNGFGYGIAKPDGISRTLSARYYKDGSEILIEQKDKNPRRLTPRECARLQGFPDDFKTPVSDTQAYKQFGNSVVVPLMCNIAQLVVAKLTDLEKKQQLLKAIIEKNKPEIDIEKKVMAI